MQLLYTWWQTKRWEENTYSVQSKCVVRDFSFYQRRIQALIDTLNKHFNSIEWPLGGWCLKLYTIIFEADTPAGKSFDVAIVWAILLSVLMVKADSVQNLRQGLGHLYLRLGIAHSMDNSNPVSIVSFLTTPRLAKFNGSNPVRTASQLGYTWQ